MQTMRMEGRERARERVSKIPRKNPFDVRRSYVRHTTLLTGSNFPKMAELYLGFSLGFQIKYLGSNQQSTETITCIRN